MRSLPTDDDDPEKGTLRTVLAIVVLAVVMAVMLAAIWIQLSDRLNGIDAYRTKWLIDQRDGYKEQCEENLKITETLQEWIRQGNLKPPPELMTKEPCVQPEQFNEKGDH